MSNKRRVMTGYHTTRNVCPLQQNSHVHVNPQTTPFLRGSLAVCMQATAETTRDAPHGNSPGVVNRQARSGPRMWYLPLPPPPSHTRPDLQRPLVPDVRSCHVMSCHVRSGQVRSCHVMSCHVMSRHVISCQVTLCGVVSCCVGKGKKGPRKRTTCGC